MGNCALASPVLATKAAPYIVSSRSSWPRAETSPITMAPAASPFTVAHSKTNAGPNTNGSQFFITFVPCPWLDGKHTVFGEVDEGHELLEMLERCGSQSGKPRAEVVIAKSGELKDEE